MLFQRISYALCAILISSGVQVVAQSTEYPDLRGRWNSVEGGAALYANGNYLLGGGEDATSFFVISDQKGAIVSGIYGWEILIPDVLGNDGEKDTQKSEEKIVGVFRNPSEVYFVDGGDPSIRLIELQDDRTMRMILIEPGENAVVAYGVYVRE